jgi:hypothetical protein
VYKNELIIDVISSSTNLYIEFSITQNSMDLNSGVK